MSDVKRAGDAGAIDFLRQLRAANLRRIPDFKSGNLHDWSPAERGNELAGEAGEACNELKKLLRHDMRTCGKRGPHGWCPHCYVLLEKAASELADVLICVDLIGAQLGLDLAEIVRQKFNAQSDKIGSKVKL